MELAPGQTLEELLAKRRPKVPETLKFATQIADALATASGLVKILDFGLAKLTDTTVASDEDATANAGGLHIARAG